MPTYLAIQQSGFWKEKQWDLDIHQDKSERPIDIIYLIYLRRLHRISTALYMNPKILEI